MTLYIETFCNTLSQFNINLSDSKKKLLLDTFPSAKDRSYIVIDKLFEIRFTEKMSKAYTKVQIGDTDEEEVAVDTCGYTGNFHR